MTDEQFTPCLVCGQRREMCSRQDCKRFEKWLEKIERRDAEDRAKLESNPEQLALAKKAAAAAENDRIAAAKKRARIARYDHDRKFHPKVSKTFDTDEQFNEGVTRAAVRGYAAGTPIRFRDNDDKKMKIRCAFTIEPAPPNLTMEEELANTVDAICPSCSPPAWKARKDAA